MEAPDCSPPYALTVSGVAAGVAAGSSWETGAAGASMRSEASCASRLALAVAAFWRAVIICAAVAVTRLMAATRVVPAYLPDAATVPSCLNSTRPEQASVSYWHLRAFCRVRQIERHWAWSSETERWELDEENALKVVADVSRVCLSIII